MEELCTRFLEAWETNRIDKLVLIPMFILDFLCIHPFSQLPVVKTTGLKKVLVD